MSYKMIGMAIYLTDLVCNGSCNFCLVGYNQMYNRNFHKGFSQNEFLKGVYSIIKEQNRDNVDISSIHLGFNIWGGEPLINSHLVDVLNCLKKEFLSSKVSIFITTNGYSISKIKDILLGLNSENFNIYLTISYDYEHYKLYDVMNDYSVIQELCNAGIIKKIFTVVSPTDSDNSLLRINNKIKDLNVEWVIRPLIGYNSSTKLFDTFNVKKIIYQMEDILSSIEENHINEFQRSILFNFLILFPDIGNKYSFYKYDYICSRVKYHDAIDLNGNRWGCHHDYEFGIPLDVSDSLDYSKPIDCKICDYRYNCISMCVGAKYNIISNNCESRKIFFKEMKDAFLRRGLFSILEDEIKKASTMKEKKLFRFQTYELNTFSKN